MDSNVFGPVAKGLITAQAKCIIWPPKRWRMLPAEFPADRLVSPVYSSIFDSSNNVAYSSSQPLNIELQNDAHFFMETS